MTRMIHTALFALLSFAISPSCAIAQSTQNDKVLLQELPDIQKDKAKFTRGFYMAYMSGIIYNVKGLPDMLLKAYVDKEVIKKQTDSDILLNAQDCVEENMRTLKVTPIDNDWCKVSFIWYSSYESVPSREHIIMVKVDEHGKGYKITEVKVAE